MAVVHQRVGLQRWTDFEYSCNNEGRRAHTALGLTTSARNWHCPHLQLGHQGSKNSCKVSELLFPSFIFSKFLDYLHSMFNAFFTNPFCSSQCSCKIITTKLSNKIIENYLRKYLSQPGYLFCPLFFRKCIVQKT